MAERYNSQRTLYRATYVPTKFAPPVQSNGGGTITAATQPGAGRVMRKVAYIRGLNIRPAEFAKLIGPTTPATPISKKHAAPINPTNLTTPNLLDVVKSVTTNLSPHLMANEASILRGNVSSDLQAIGQQLVAVRQGTIADINQLVAAIRAAYANSHNIGEQLVDTAKALTWAYQTSEPNLLQLLAIIQQTTPKPLVSGLADAQSLFDRITALFKEASATQTLIDDFLLGFTFEPVGRLHLERMEMIPIGVEHGELVYSVPLTPKEIVNIAHREWSETATTFENIVQDFFEGFSELGVAEKTDIATSTSNETRHQSSFDANGSVNFSYNGSPYSLTTSAAVDYGTKSDDSQATKDSRAHAMSITRTASARTRKDHKQTFRVAAVAGTADSAVRVLTNPSDKDAMRVDYFRLMRKWQVDLIRYGLRMTYDLVIPNPGNSLASKVLELQSIIHALNTGFEFTLKLSDVDPTTYQSLAQSFGVSVDAPPAPPGDLSQSAPLQKTDNQWQWASMQFSVPDEFQISSARIWADYYFDSPPDAGGNHPKRTWFGVKDGAPKKEFPNDVGGQHDTYDSDNTTLDPNRQFSKSLEQRSGQVSIDYMWYHVDTGDVNVAIKLLPKATTIDAWRMKTWNALRQAGQDAYAAQINSLQSRKAELEKDIAGYDSLTLRRMEREEIMRLVLVWLFGPSFQLVPTMFELLGLTESLVPSPDPSPEYALNPALMTLSDWMTVRKYGEFIKYIQNAIEWENVVFFSYPYWWDLVENWPFKRFLVHPDFDHRTFLRAGCARVVLTIRPGFECSFAQLVEHFTLQTDPNTAPGACSDALGDHPYVTIGDEIRNYAMTNYEHIPPANPDRNVRPLLYPLQQRAWADMEKIILALDQYDRDQHTANPNLDPNVHVYPVTLDLLPNAASLNLNDPWGRPFVYKFPGDNADFDLVTYGAAGDPKKDGPLLDTHITSWAEGNVVGRWNEYTPTAALDVAINLTLPTKPEPA